MVRVVEFKGQYRITLPRELAISKGWEAGTVLRFVENVDGNIILKPVQMPKKKESKSGKKS